MIFLACNTASSCCFWHCHPYLPLHFLKMFLILVCVHFWYPNEGCCSYKRLSNASKQISKHQSFLLHIKGKGAESLQKVPDLTNTGLTSSLHVCKHLTHTGSSIKRFATCCYPSMHCLNTATKLYYVSLLFGSAILFLR